MTRMGLHVHAHLGWDEAVEYCRVVKPAIMKWLSPSRQVLERCHAVSPGTKHVLRPYWANQDLGGAHDAFVRHSQDGVREFGQLIDWYEGYNEFACHDHQLLRRFCSAEMDRARKLNAMGVGCAMGGFSTGAFDQGGKAYDAVKPMLEFLHATGPHNVWHSHEYAGPYMGYMTRTADGRNQWPRTPSNPGGSYNGWSQDSAQYWRPGLDGWLTLRYRMLREKLVADGLTNVHMIFTECGVDDTNPRPGGANRKGWRDYRDSEWSRIPGQGDFASQLYWYGWHLSRDPYVLGWCDFGWGSEDPQWWSFSLDKTPDMLARVVQTQTTLPIGAEGTKMLKIIDVSQWQGAIDWTRMKAAGADAVLIRAGGGLGRPTARGEVDTRYQTYIAGAEAAGIPWGPYWWYANGLSGADQSRAFARVVGSRVGTVAPWADWELNDDEVTEVNLRGSLETCAALLGRPLVYTSLGWARPYISNRWTWLREYPLALARYTSAATTEAPAPWSDWTVWQWSAGGNGQGPAHGAASADLDISRFRGTLADFLALTVRPASGLNVDALVRAAVRHHEETGIRVNPEAALFKHAAKRGLCIVTNEAMFGEERVPFVVAESYTGTRRKAVLYWYGGQVHEVTV
jgi:GH25 family lysozyme M1 (1,4-beta-N-acetylmuramidase)